MACILVSACGGGGGGGTPATTTPAASAPATPAVVEQTQAQKEADAGRLAKQATFGATPDLVNHIVSIGVSAWLDEQFAATGSSYSDIAASPVPAGSCGTDRACQASKFGRQSPALRFYNDALTQPDQLRQRVAFALSQLVVASAQSSASTAAAIGAFNQLFLDNAFGNYRTLLQQVTLHGYMGTFLNMSGSTKAAPNENYAREFLQLFTMGPNKLNMDGSLIADSTGAAQPNYTSDDIKGIARALTGWVVNTLPADKTNIDISVPMIQVPAAYDTTAKSFLGTSVAAGAAQTDSVNAVIDAAFNNASTPPYVAKFLIQQLVTSNPSAAYVGRVAAVFVNNGSNVRGDLKAVIRAILTDTEARTAPTGDGYGKVKEPILLMTAIARAAGIVSDGQIFLCDQVYFSEPVFLAPSVFNFYPPDYPLPQSTTLVSPASKLMTTSSIVRRHNLVYDWTIGATTTRADWAPVTSVIPNATGSSLDWTPWEALNGDPAAIIDRIDLVMTNRTMSAAQKTALTNAINAQTNADTKTQARLRAATALYIVGTSPFFQVDR